MYTTASLVDAVDVILLNNTDYGTSPFRPILNMMD